MSYYVTMQIALILLFLGLLWLCISLQKTYAAVPPRELKRRARAGDELAAALYKAASYGHSLRAVLWLLIGASAGAFFIVSALTLPIWAALLLAVFVIWLGFVWLPSSRVTKTGNRIALKLAPGFSWLLNYLHPLLDRVISFIRRHRPIRIHTGLYDTDDLLTLIEQQQVQADNRIDKAELELARNALQFGAITVHDVLTPRRVVKMVKVDEPVGPVLMTEMHDSGHSRFPVYEGKKDNIVGILYLRDLLSAKHIGTVRSLMHESVCYVHEEQPLLDALQAVLKTHQQLFVVVNSFEEYVGIITIEDILERIIGKPIIDEFDQYHDLRAVAARQAREDHKTHTEPEKPTDVVEEPELPQKAEETSSDDPEVIE
jgi:CBS domain containing-hemolysin-like protein